MGGIRIRGVGHDVPKRSMGNGEFPETLGTSDEWIVSHTGIHSRHLVEDETHLLLSTNAARKAMEDAGVRGEDIGVCIVASMAPDYIVPGEACLLQRDLGLKEDTFVFDMNVACSGFVYALHAAECLLASSPRRFALVIGSEVMSRLLDWNDRATCILFGDAAGCAVVEYREEWDPMPFVSGVRGDDELLLVPGVGKGVPSVVAMEGQRVFRFAVETIPVVIGSLLDKTGKTMEDIDAFVLHQANERILDSSARKCGIPQEKLLKNVGQYGNTSAASVPVLLSESVGEGKIRKGDTLLLAAFGGGLTWGGAIVRMEGEKTT